MPIRRHLLAAGLAFLAGLAAGSPVRAQVPDTITLDWAYYNPVSLVLKQEGWLEEELAADGIAVRWVQSLGSNKALEFLKCISPYSLDSFRKENLVKEWVVCAACLIIVWISIHRDDFTGV